ncbi:MAG TPA: hypothetical protein DDZ51_15335 [Planctomycetaceae bacterium]|nr:hypothetical protein [Planctomycetaceae bacterium]
MKRITDAQILGEMGVNLIQKMVLKMGFTWHPSNQPVEAGIDGWVELRDDATGQVKNCWIPVQSKAVSEIIEAKGAPTYYCKPADLQYWLEGSTPVILVVSVPEDEIAYWVNIKDYFRDKDSKNDKTIRFDPIEDRLNESSAQQWKAIGNRYGAGTYFTPSPTPEKLMSNLIRVDRIGETIFTAETDCESGKDFQEKLKEIEPYPPREWAYGNGKRVYSYHDLSNEPWSLVCNVTTVTTIDADAMASSTDPKLRSVFVQILNGCFNEITNSWRLRWDSEQECHYFKPHPRDIIRDFHYRSRKKKTQRAVVSKQMNKAEPTRVAYYRHNAFSHRFLRFADSWFLMIEPTYVFTSDGLAPDPYRQEHLSGIKNLEKDAAVSGAIVMYTEMLKDRDSLLDDPYPFLGFGSIEWAECPVGIDDKAWTRIKSLVPEESDDIDLSNFGAGLFDE